MQISSTRDHHDKPRLRLAHLKNDAPRTGGPNPDGSRAIDTSMRHAGSQGGQLAEKEHRP